MTTTLDWILNWLPNVRRLLERGFRVVQNAVARLFDADLRSGSTLIDLADDGRQQGIGAFENKVHGKTCWSGKILENTASQKLLSPSLSDTLKRERFPASLEHLRQPEAERTNGYTEGPVAHPTTIEKRPPVLSHPRTFPVLDCMKFRTYEVLLSANGI